MSSSPIISPDSQRVIAEFGKTEAFKELFAALEAGFVEDWKVSAQLEDRELAWHMHNAALALHLRIKQITKKSES